MIPAVLVGRIAIVWSMLAAGMPAQPASVEAVQAWLKAFNHPDPAMLRAFRDERGGPDRLADAGLRMRTGGFRLLRVESSDALQATVLLEELYSDGVSRLTVRTAPGEPPRIAEWTLQPVARPADLAIPRLPEPEAVAALTSRADLLARDDRFSGVLLVANPERVVLERSWGMARRDTGEAVTGATRFRLGSLNKVFTAVAVLQLVEAGRVDLDAPLGRYLAGYPNSQVATTVTIRHLLSHRGGTGDIFGPEYQRERLGLRSLDDYLRLFGSRPPAFEPGSRFQYSNFGYILLGAVIERVTGRSYYDHVRSAVFEPAGMRDTESLPEDQLVATRSHGYTWRDGNWVSNADGLPWRGTSAGGGYSTARDLLAFARALQAGRLLSRPMLDAATTVTSNGYGMGFIMRGEGRYRAWGHSGGAPGMNAELRVLPDLGIVFVALSNLDPPAATRLMDFFLRRIDDPGPTHPDRAGPARDQSAAGRSVWRKSSPTNSSESPASDAVAYARQSPKLSAARWRPRPYRRNASAARVHSAAPNGTITTPSSLTRSATSRPVARRCRPL